MQFQISLFIKVLCILSVSNLWLQASQVPVVREFLLQEKTIYEIPISRKAPTTICFPKKLESIEGVGITKEDSDAPIKFSYQEGRSYFTVKANRDKAEGTLNVIYCGKVYSLKCIESVAPFRKVSFYENASAGVYGTLKKGSERSVTPKILLNLLDQAKLYPVLKESHPTIIDTIEYSQLGTVDDYGNFLIVLEEALRFDHEDTLVFRLRFKNKTNIPIYYAPQSLAACIGNQRYEASLVDASGIIPSDGEAVGYFCITGKPDGGRAGLSLKNQFQICVYEVHSELHLKKL